MSDRRDRDHYDRPSWKDIDKKKDSSSHSSGDASRRNLDDRKITTGYNQYRSDLDDLFASGDASKLVKEVLSKAPGGDEPRDKKKSKEKSIPERQKLLRGLRAAASPREVEKLLDEFLARWDLPDDIDVLTQALDHADEGIQARALTMISSWLDGHILKSRNVLQNRVRRLATRSEDDDVRALAKVVNRKL
jgi:hypothetical protein